MADRRITVLPLTLGTLFVASFTAGCSIDINGEDTIVREERSYTVNGEPALQVDTFDGSVQIGAWDRPEVRVRIEKHGRDRDQASALKVEIVQDGSRIRVKALAPTEDSGTINFGPSRSVSMAIMLPRTARIQVRSGDGSISVEDVTGRLELHSQDGSIRASGVGGEVLAQSGDGSVHLDGRLALVRATTQDGSVSIDAAAGSAPSADWEISTGDGSVSMNLPGSFDANVDAQSGDGSVSITGIPAANGGSDRQSVRGTLGRGGHMLKVRSGDGSIRIATR